MGGRGLREISVTTQFQGTLFHDEMVVEYRMACQRVLEIPPCFVSIDMTFEDFLSEIPMMTPKLLKDNSIRHCAKQT